MNRFKNVSELSIIRLVLMGFHPLSFMMGVLSGRIIIIVLDGNRLFGCDFD